MGTPCGSSAERLVISGGSLSCDRTAARDVGRRLNDRLKTAEKAVVFRRFWTVPIVAGRMAAIIPHMIRNCGSLLPKSLTRLAGSRVVLRCVVGVVYVDPFREVRAGFACRRRGWRQSGHHDGLAGAGADDIRGSGHSGAPYGRRWLTVHAEGRDACGQPLVLSHR